jgi:hypothetical protein
MDGSEAVHRLEMSAGDFVRVKHKVLLAVAGEAEALGALTQRGHGIGLGAGDEQ